MATDAPSTIADRVKAEMDALCAISSPWGDHAGAERCLGLAQEFAPDGARVERIPSSSSACVNDLVLRWQGSGSRRVMLLGHVDTVISHAAHRPVEQQGERLVGSGTADMKGGVAVSLAVARELVRDPAQYAELALLLVTDEEWRVQPFKQADHFSGYDACLCFEAGERTADGQEAAIVKRKGALTLSVDAVGRASHSGSQPDAGANALLALAEVARSIAERHDPAGPDHLTVVPTILHSGEALNMVPPDGELTFDVRSDRTDAFDDVMAAIPSEIAGVSLSPRMQRVWPAMDSRAATAELLRAAGELYGAPIIASTRGGASDASHFAPTIPLTIDGLGPLGANAHNPEEYVIEDSLAPRTAVALAIARAALGVS